MEVSTREPRDYAFAREMTQLGEQGWELVFAHQARDSKTEDYNYEMIFKRPATG